jgi:hypothetical protein
MLKHHKCGGNLSVNVTNLLIFKSPSVSFSSRGMTVGVLELQSKDSGQPSFHCGKCGGELSLKELDQITVECMVCRKNKRIKEIFNSEVLPSICDSCLDGLTGKKDPEEDIQRISRLLSIPKDMVFLPFSDILRMKILFQ